SLSSAEGAIGSASCYFLYFRCSVFWCANTCLVLDHLSLFWILRLLHHLVLDRLLLFWTPRLLHHLVLLRTALFYATGVEGFIPYITPWHVAWAFQIGTDDEDGGDDDDYDEEGEEEEGGDPDEPNDDPIQDDIDVPDPVSPSVYQLKEEDVYKSKELKVKGKAKVKGKTMMHSSAEAPKRSDDKVVFSTGNGKVTSSQSMGEMVEVQGLPFVWIPGQLPAFLPKGTDVNFDESVAHFACRLEGFVPIFRDRIEFALPVSGEPSSSEVAPDCKAVAPGETASEPIPDVDAPAVGSAEGEGAGDLSREQELVRQANSTEHKMLHIPKNPYCSICRRSKMYQRRTTKKREEPLVDRGNLEPVDKFGQRLATDYIVPTRSDGPSVQVIRDEFSGLLRAYVGKRTTENAARNLLQFVGSAASDLPNVLVKTDCDRSLTAAISQVGWAQEPSLQNRWPHNAQLERHIRTLEETTRASHLGAGFHLLQDLWPISVAYAANALNIVKWKGEQTFYELATGAPFYGPRLALGRLVHYRVHDATKRGKFDASTLPGVFAGWKLDAASVYKGVVYVLDYNKLRTRSLGFEFPVAVPFEEVFVPDEETFPLQVAADKALAEFKDAALEEITALDIPFSEITCSRDALRKRNEYITLDRIIKYGPTPGCGACAFDTKTHTPVCRARFNALVKADRITKPSKPPVSIVHEEKKDDGTAVPPASSTDLGFNELFEDQNVEDYYPRVTSPASDVGSEYAPSEPESEGELHVAATLQVDDDFKTSNVERNRSRRINDISQVLFDFSYGSDSQICALAEQSHVKCVRISHDLLDLSSQEDVDQLLGQVEALPGCDIWASMPDAHRVSQQKPKADGSSKRQRTRQRQKDERMLALALPVFQKCIDKFGRVSVHWPDGSELPNLPIWIEFEKRNFMRRVHFHGCMLGACRKHYPVKLPLVVSTNCIRTVEIFSQYQCNHSHVHERAGAPSMFCSDMMAKVVIDSYYPSKLHTFAPDHSHAFVTRNLSRKEWTANPKAVEAVKAEAAGLRANETWDDSSVRLLSDLKREARENNKTVKIADILTLCGEKFSELPEEFRKFKGRVVYRGDKIYDELGNLVQFTDTATNPTAITALNVALWFACMPGNTASSSDAIQAFLQSVLPEETWVALPPELWLDKWHRQFKKGDRVVVRLKKSLYGHPLAGKLWEEHLSARLKELGGTELQSYPSNWVFTRKDQDFQEQGTLHQDAAKILMKTRQIVYASVPNCLQSTLQDNFLELKRQRPDEFFVPTDDIDCNWHAHQLHPWKHEEETAELCGRVNDRSSGSQLSVRWEQTKQAWKVRRAFLGGEAGFIHMYPVKHEL
ncbi:unnamed protein product, partial [Symbiodinium sp. KB8]